MNLPHRGGHFSSNSPFATCQLRFAFDKKPRRSGVNFVRRPPAQSTRMFAAWITLAYLSTSSLKNTASSSGLPPTGSSASLG
jgi:hypothetical protein